MTKQDAIKQIRNRVRGKVRESGIWLVANFRYRESAQDVVRLVAEAGGDSYMVKYGDHRTTFPYQVTFSVSIDADMFIARGIRLAPLTRESL